MYRSDSERSNAAFVHREGIEAFGYWVNGYPFLHANSFGEFWLYTTPDHGPTTRTHTQIYAVRRVYSAGTHPVASPPSPVSHAPVGSGITRRVRTEPLQPHPTFSSPESACASGTGWRRLQYPPPSGESTDAMARGSHKAVPSSPSHHPLPPHQHCLVSTAGAIVFFLVLPIAAAAPHRRILIRPSRAPVELFKYRAGRRWKSRSSSPPRFRFRRCAT